MVRRAAVNTAEGYHMPAEQFTAMTAAMMELAMRGSREEGLVMRIAKAGGIKEVTKDLTRLRTYAKKQGLVRAPRPPKAGGAAAPGGKRKRKKKGSSASDGEQGAGAGAEG